MSPRANLLARKQLRIERLQQGPGAHERDEIERQLDEIDEALRLLDEAGLMWTPRPKNEPISGSAAAQLPAL